MRDERLGRRAARNRLHHRRLDFEEIAVFKKSPQQPTMRERFSNTVAHVGIDHQIDIALAVTRFDIGQTMPLLRQRSQTLGQQAQARCASTVSSLVLVRNRWPETPTMSPMSKV